jgi:hypothetical protein
MRRRILAVLLLAAAAVGARVAFASTLGAVTVQRVTTFAAASTVPTSSCNGTDDFDTWIDHNSPNASHGGSATLRVNAQRPTYALLQFTPCAPANAKVLSATMSLYVDTEPNHQPRTHEVHAITSSWARSVTWNTQPSVSGTISATATPGAAGTWTSWDLTGDVQSMVNGGTNYGWEIQDNDNKNANALYESLQNTNVPDLSIVYYP